MKAKSFEELYEKAKEKETYLSATIVLEFTEGLSELMEVNNISRKELAQRLGTSPAYVTKILRGDVNFMVYSMVRLAKAVGGTVQVHIGPQMGPLQLPAVSFFEPTQPENPTTKKHEKAF